MRMAFCYQIRRCTDDVRPEGKAQRGLEALAAGLARTG